MKGLFNYDNPVMRFIGKFWDVLILNILWMICSIPIITIGASSTAVYYVTLKLARDDDGYTFRSFFHSFKENFRQATIIWLIFLAIGVVLFCDLWFVITVDIVPAGTPRMVASALFIGMLIVWFVVLTYVFPVLARFYGTIKQTILNAFLLAFRYLLYTIAMVAVDIGIVYLTFTSLPVLSMLGFGLIAFLNSYFLQQIFKKYIPKEEPESEELRPLFADEEVGENGEEPIYTMFVRNDTAGPAEPAEPEALLGDAAAAEPAVAETALETGVTSETGSPAETTPAEEDAEAAETAAAETVVSEGETVPEAAVQAPSSEEELNRKKPDPDRNL